MPRLFIALLLFLPVLASGQLKTVIQKGHEAAVISLGISAEGTFMASGSKDNSIKLWDLSTGKELNTFFGHLSPVTSIAISQDHEKMITTSYDRTYRVFSIPDGELLYTSPSAEKGLTSVAISPDGNYFVVGGFTSEVLKVDLNSYETIGRIKVNPEQGLGYGVDLKFSPNGRVLAIGEDNRTLQVYDPRTFTKRNTFTLDYGWCGGCATFSDISDDGSLVAQISNKDTLKIYSLHNGSLVHKYGPELEDVQGIAFVDDENQYLLIANESTVFKYDLGKRQVTSLVIHPREEIINDIKVLPGGLFVTAHDDNISRLYDLNGNLVRKFSGINNYAEISALGFNPNEYWESNIARYLRQKNDWVVDTKKEEILRGKIGSSARRWNYTTGEVINDYHYHDKAVVAMTTFREKDLLITGDATGKIIIWSNSTGDSIRSIDAHRHPIFDLDISNDGTKLVSVSWDASARIWDIQSGEMLHYFDFENNSPYTVRFSPNDLYLVLGQLGNQLSMVEIDTKQKVREFIGHTGIVTAIEFSDNRIITSAEDGTIRIWNIVSGLMDKKITSPSKRLNTLIVSSQGEILTGGFDRNIYAYSTETGKLEKIFKGHQSEVSNIFISEDDNLLITGSIDGSTIFWNYNEGTPFFEHIIVGLKDWMVTSPEGYFSATSGARQVINFVDDLKAYSPEQFFDNFYRPDLIQEVFRARGIKRLPGQGMLEKLQKYPPPKVKINVLPSEEEGYADIYCRVINAGGGIKKINLYHNGKVLDRSWNIKSREDTLTRQIKMPLIAGKNSFGLTAISDGDLESMPSESIITSDLATKPPVCHIFSIGINKYQNEKLNLNYAADDAFNFTQIAEEKGKKIFNKVYTYELYDYEATKANIINKFEELSEIIAPEDVFIFYYAGHGSIAEETFYFIPHESTRLYDDRNLQRSALSAVELNEKLKNIKALKQVIFMDACQSGGSIDVLAHRGAVEEKALAQLSRSAGIHILAAAGSEQFATEYAELKHGLFTYTLLKAMEGEADGAPQDGKITIYELKSFIDTKVPELNRQYKGKTQYPYTFSKGSDFPLGVVNKE